MKSLSLSFPNTRFDASFYEEVLAVVRAIALQESINYPGTTQTAEEHQEYANRIGEGSYGDGFSVTHGHRRRSYDRMSEVLPELRIPYDATSLNFGRWVKIVDNGWSVEVELAGDLAEIDRCASIFESRAPAYAKPAPPPERPRIFIGHGGSGAWQETERWLTQLGFEVKAYETLPHAGRTIEKVLENALAWANFALLVMTAEDEMADKSVQARQNVVHELGLFQGRLGWERAVVMLEEGVAEFSNIAGTNQLRFPAGMISAKHGDIAIALKEHFPEY